ncbi:hypothetical protein Y032_0320g2408 [Ancylostoma ceylanicum]|uniref:Uncharacterized protein n=1 Tax=Ancylostoma ceylanicum TaxID=53326 RepID=A0A016S0Y8_9BILA|nr:hypothetical protein Y032_0320g2408 [Ancylostoma ceylanicum]
MMTSKSASVLIVKLPSSSTAAKGSCSSKFVGQPSPSSSVKLLNLHLHLFADVYLTICGTSIDQSILFSSSFLQSSTKCMFRKPPGNRPAIGPSVDRLDALRVGAIPSALLTI